MAGLATLSRLSLATSYAVRSSVRDIHVPAQLLVSPGEVRGRLLQLVEEEFPLYRQYQIEQHGDDPGEVCRLLSRLLPPCTRADSRAAPRMHRTHGRAGAPQCFPCGARAGRE